MSCKAREHYFIEMLYIEVREITGRKINRDEGDKGDKDTRNRNKGEA